jgi:hypothetical protein
MQKPPIVFLGPTLRPSAAAKLCHADIRGPAGMGDITRAVVEMPPAIVLIDGLFESGPSVWHKEILWALSLGIPVIGLSSLGALRATELADHGMLGVGKVYSMYRTGFLKDDDEVAVAHGPRELDFLPLTDAMVDIRHAISLAEEARQIDSRHARSIISDAKHCHFKSRSLSRSVATAMQGSSDGPRLLSWLQHLPALLKEQDARDALLHLPDVIGMARAHLEKAPKDFISTVYLKRLTSFGFRSATQKDD